MWRTYGAELVKWKVSLQITLSCCEQNIAFCCHGWSPTPFKKRFQRCPSSKSNESHVDKTQAQENKDKYVTSVNHPGVVVWKQRSYPFQKSWWDNPFLPLPWPHHRKHIKASQTINPHRSATIIQTPPWCSRSFKPLSCRWSVYLSELKNTYQWLRLPIVAETYHDTTVKRQSGLDKWRETGSREVKEQEPKYFPSRFRVSHILANHTFPKKLQNRSNWMSHVRIVTKTSAIKSFV